MILYLVDGFFWPDESAVSLLLTDWPKIYRPGAQVHVFASGNYTISQALAGGGDLAGIKYTGCDQLLRSAFGCLADAPLSILPYVLFKSDR
jgi:hypothetical protein